VAFGPKLRLSSWQRRHSADMLVPNDAGPGKARRLSRGSQGSGNTGRAGRLSQCSQWTALRSSPNELVDHAYDRKLLLGVSKLHILMVLSPCSAIGNVLEPFYHDGGGIPIDQVIRGRRPPWNIPPRLWVIVLFILLSALPRLYAQYGIDETSCNEREECNKLESVLRHPIAVIIGPTLLVVAVLAFKFFGALLTWIDDEDSGIIRRIVRAPLQTLYFSVMRKKMPRIQYKDFYLDLGIPNHTARLTLSMSYAILMVGLIYLAIEENIRSLLTGLVVAYAFGEAYCKTLDKVLSPRHFVSNIVHAKFRGFDSQDDLWTRLFETNGQTFSMTSEQASHVMDVIDHAIQRGILTASVPRRLTQIFISDTNHFIDWDDLPQDDIANASDVGSDLEALPITANDDNVALKAQAHEQFERESEAEVHSKSYKPLPEVVFTLPTPVRALQGSWKAAAPSETNWARSEAVGWPPTSSSNVPESRSRQGSVTPPPLRIRSSSEAFVLPPLFPTNLQGNLPPRAATPPPLKVQNNFEAVALPQTFPSIGAQDRLRPGPPAPPPYNFFKNSEAMDGQPTYSSRAIGDGLQTFSAPPPPNIRISPEPADLPAASSSDVIEVRPRSGSAASPPMQNANRSKAVELPPTWVPDAVQGCARPISPASSPKQNVKRSKGVDLPPTWAPDARQGLTRPVFQIW